MERGCSEWGKGERFVCPQTSRGLYFICFSVAAPEEETRTQKLRFDECLERWDLYCEGSLLYKEFPDAMRGTSEARGYCGLEL